MEKLDFETILVESAKLPMVRIDRGEFLRRELHNKYSPEVIDDAINNNPAHAGIPIEEVRKIAKSCINEEATKVTAISTVAGIPGGLAMIGTVPVDLAQYYGFILRIVQKLIYLYGWQDLDLKSDVIDTETKNLFTLFVGIMFGAKGAVGAVQKISVQVAQQVAKKLPQKALTKGIIYPIVKKVATMLGVQMTKEVFAKGVAKVVPVIGGVVSGAVTFVSYKPMCEKLRKHLETFEVANVDFYKNLNTDIDIYDAENVVELGDK